MKRNDIYHKNHGHKYEMRGNSKTMVVCYCGVFRFICECCGELPEDCECLGPKAIKNQSITEVR